MNDRLKRIIDAHQEIARNDIRDRDELFAKAMSSPQPRDFAAALCADGLSVIAEVKRRSPSVGAIDEDLNASQLALNYEAGGAACISVLTDEQFFGGSVADLHAVRSCVQVPVLRKDFTVDARDISDARIMGADAVLLIVAALDDQQLHEFVEAAARLQLTALVEAHTRDDVERALAVGASVIGINQRDLTTFEVNRNAAASMIELLDSSTINVAESAIESSEDARRLAEVGFDAVLVGTALVRNADPASVIRRMTGAT